MDDTQTDHPASEVAAQASLTEAKAKAAAAPEPTLRQGIQQDIERIRAAVKHYSETAEAEIAKLEEKVVHPLLAEFIDKPLSEARDFFRCLLHHFS